MTLNHNFPSNRQVETEDDQKIDSLGDAMSRHRKVAGWYKDMMEDDQYRSNAVYLEVKMRELLGDSWPEQSSGPDVVRASVCCDMLGRLIDSAPTIKELGHKLLEELVVSIFQARSATSPTLGEIFFLLVWAPRRVGSSPAAATRLVKLIEEIVDGLIEGRDDITSRRQIWEEIERILM